jgi:multiple sugar transport system permease protein
MSVIPNNKVLPGWQSLAERRAQRAVRKRARRSNAQLQRSNLTAYLMIAPMVLLLGVFVIYPLGYAVWLSGHRISFYKPAVWVGLDFYRYVLTDPRFWHSLRVGLTYSAIVVPAGLVIAVLLASFIKTLSTGIASILKVTVYVPAVIASVLTANIFVLVYQDAGIANTIVGHLGIGPVAWLNDPSIALAAVAVPGVWLGFGISTLIVLAAMLDIPSSYYESAALDGANAFQTMWYITLPLLRNVFVFLAVTGFTISLQEFLLPLIMTNGGGPVDRTLTPNLFILNSFRDSTPYATSFSLAASLLLFVVLGSISLLIFKAISSVKAVDG